MGITIEFGKKWRSSYNYTAYIRGHSGTYEKCATYFKEYGVELPDASKALYRSHDMDDTYRIEVDGLVNCFKALVITVSQFDEYYRRNTHFCSYSKYALDVLMQLSFPENQEKISENDQKQLQEIATAFQATQLKKNQELIHLHKQLRSIAKRLALSNLHTFPELSTLDTAQDIFVQNEQLMENNILLHQAITEAARRQVKQYNESALKAITLSLSMAYITKRNPTLVKEAVAAYDSHLNPEKEFMLVSSEGIEDMPALVPIELPEPSKIYPYLEPESEFAHFDDASNSWYHDKMTLSTASVNELRTKVNRLIHHHGKCEEEQSRWVQFFITIKNFFSYIYDKIILLLKSAKHSFNPIEQHSDLAENVDRITKGEELTRKASLVHRFNSAPSPLVAVIYDKTLTSQEKEDLLAKLARAKPYRFHYQKIETRKNIEITADSQGGSSYCPQGYPLHHAIMHGTINMVRILLKNGANPNATGIYIGIRHIHYDGVTPLHIAVAMDDVATVELLLQNGADANAVNSQGQTALHAVNTVEIYQLLVKHGANINQADNFGKTPLHFAVAHNQLEIVNALVNEKDLQLNKADKIGNSALHLAAAMNFEIHKPSYYFSISRDENPKKKQQNLKIMELLLSKFADVNQQNLGGYTPLHLAVLDGRGIQGYDWVHHNKKLLDYEHILNKVKMLCENNADVNLTSAEHIKKDFYCSEDEHQHPAPTTTPLLALYTHQSYESDGNKSIGHAKLSVAKYLITQGAKYNVIYAQRKNTNGIYQEQGNNLLHQCARLTDSAGFEYFASLGLDVNYQHTAFHETPLHVFMWNAKYHHYSKDTSLAFMEMLPGLNVDVNQIMIKKIHIDENTRHYFDATEIMAIFKQDNIFSQHAKTMQLTVDESNCKQLFRKVCETIAEKQHLRIDITLPQAAIEYSGCKNPAVLELLSKKSEKSAPTLSRPL